MKTRINFPPYIDMLEEYAAKNLEANGFRKENVRSTWLRVSLRGESPVFEQVVLDKDGRHLLDCWKIYRLAKMIQNDSFRTFSVIKVEIRFRDGQPHKVSCTLTAQEK